MKKFFLIVLAIELLALTTVFAVINEPQLPDLIQASSMDTKYSSPLAGESCTLDDHEVETLTIVPDSTLQFNDSIEISECIAKIGGEWSEEDCEWCKYLITFEERTIVAEKMVIEGGRKYTNVQFNNGQGLDFLTDYELYMVRRHSYITN